MTRFQLDECFDSKDLHARCNATKLCVTHRYPKDMKGVKDPDMLPVLLRKEAALVTTDRNIVNDNIDYIPYPHSGIIAVHTCSSRSITTSMGEGILHKFKTIFSSWNDTDWSGVFLELNENGASVHLVGQGDISSIGSANFNDPGFTSTFLRLMSEAEERKPQFLASE